MINYENMWQDLKSQILLLTAAPWEAPDARGAFTDIYASMLEMEQDHEYR